MGGGTGRQTERPHPNYDRTQEELQKRPEEEEQSDDDDSSTARIGHGQTERGNYGKRSECGAVTVECVGVASVEGLF